MEKVVKSLSIILLIISLILLPFLGVNIIFGLVGSTSKYYTLIAIGYIGLIISSLICIFRYKFFPAIIISAILIIFGIAQDQSYWNNHNEQLCEELRAEPSCVEDECGFTCSNFHGVGFVSSGSICKDKDMSLCREKFKNLMQTESDTQDILESYSHIVDKILASPSPENENFEDQLIAIYNCFEIMYGPGAKGEQLVTRTLKQKNLTEEQLNKYYAYLSSFGRHVNTERIVAGLPSGDKSLSCKDIK